MTDHRPAAASLSVQLWTVRDDLHADPDATLGRLAALGYPAVEPFGLGEGFRELPALLAKHGLRASSAHGSILDGELNEILDAAEAIGAPVVIEPSGPVERLSTLEGIQWIAAMLNARSAIAQRRGIAVGYHNHWWEFGDLGGRTALEVLAQHLLPEVVLEVDTYWAAVAGVDVAALLARLGDRVRLLHVKDGPIHHDETDPVAVGDGAMPLAPILAAAPHAIRVVELDGTRGDVWEALDRSRRALIASAAAG